VHRHQLRETLSRLCRLLTAGGAPAVRSQEARRVNGRAYTNGAAVDGKVIETAARQTGATAIEPEVVPHSQRFEPGKSDKVRRDESTASPGNQKDAPRGA
jgi:acetyl-CoA carboxylase carboxyl transferase subunit beta